MKKEYIKPVMTTVEIQHEMALLTASLGVDNGEGKTFDGTEGEGGND